MPIPSNNALGFFGYKENYFGYCRVFLENSVRDAYRDYIIHEEDIRERLIAHDETGEVS